VRALAIVLVVAALVATRTGGAAEEVPDAQLLLDLDLLSQAEPQERDLMRRLSVVERLRLLEVFRFLETRPAAPADRRPPVDAEGR
jgi:hypothetical protein